MVTLVCDGNFLESSALDACYIYHNPKIKILVYFLCKKRTFSCQHEMKDTTRLKEHN